MYDKEVYIADLFQDTNEKKEEIIEKELPKVRWQLIDIAFQTDPTTEKDKFEIYEGTNDEDECLFSALIQVFQGNNCLTDEMRQIFTEIASIENIQNISVII